ncbi:hypothetical protein Tco_1299473 [Tanacetum coccineum]
MSIIDTWTLLPPSPPLLQNASPSLSPRDTNSPPQSPSSPSQNPIRDQMVNEINELHHLSNLIDINLQHAINVSTQTPPSPPIPPPSSIHIATLDQVNLHSGLCHCCMYTRTLFHTLRDDLHRLESLITRPPTQSNGPPNNASPTSPLSPI